MVELRQVQEISDSERAYRHLRREIIEGRTEPGERIVEARVADALDVSRTPVREAVRRLETEGLVVTKPNRGAQVRTMTGAEVVDLYQARARLEGFMSELAAQRAEQADIAAIQEAADYFEAVVGQVDANSVEGLRQILRANDRFHGALVRAGRADRVFQILATAVDMPLVYAAFDLYSPSDLARSVMFHHLIADAVRAGQPDRAGRLMTEHILQGRDAHLCRGDTTEQEDQGA